jgi:hypothetical protein
MPRRLFQKGDKRPAGAGRQPGSQNRLTIEMKEMLEAAVHEMGGLEGFVAWAKSSDERQDKFWEFAMRLLPIQVQGSGKGGALVVEIKQEDLARELEARGLPPLMLNDMPLLELKAEKAGGGNGRDR